MTNKAQVQCAISIFFLITYASTSLPSCDRGVSEIRKHLGFPEMGKQGFWLLGWIFLQLSSLPPFKVPFLRLPRIFTFCPFLSFHSLMCVLDFPLSLNLFKYSFFPNPFFFSFSFVSVLSLEVLPLWNWLQCHTSKIFFL